MILIAIIVVLLQVLTVTAFLWQRRCRRLAEEEAARRLADLARAGRFALAGELSASIAHEVGQPLGAILSNAAAAGMMFDNCPETGELHLILADIRRDALRANQVVQGLRTLLQKHLPTLAMLDLNATFHESLNLISLEARRRRVIIEPHLTAANARVLGDRVQLQQVLLNLAINAMDAMDDTPAPDRVISVSTRVVRHGYELVVTDRGHGIPADGGERLFDSLYTTKPYGMGLGLSIVRTIVEVHGGRVSAASREGGGSVFTVLLPSVEQQARARPDSEYRPSAIASMSHQVATQGGIP
jgi:signal transduction histidine kinase